CKLEPGGFGLLRELGPLACSGISKVMPFRVEDLLLTCCPPWYEREDADDQEKESAFFHTKLLLNPTSCQINFLNLGYSPFVVYNSGHKRLFWMRLTWGCDEGIAGP